MTRHANTILVRGLDARTAHALSLPIFELEAWYERQVAAGREAALEQVVRELHALTQKAALVAAYTEARLEIGGAKDHAAAAKAANRMTTKVRQLLGYAYPEAVAINF